MPIPNYENDIAPGANYMDRRRCYSLYWFTPSECKDCPKNKECVQQSRKEAKE